MEEEEGTQVCQNCNRGIPKRNFVIHSVHCSRNIKVCSVCKEPVPVDELDEHNEKLHSLVPCRQCGEMARGTDMEDHVRDSCALTLQSCRFCSLELRRRSVPSHERYCGARTERCADCGEYVMLRYRQLHLDSNHGFVRLNDDSPPRSSARPFGGYMVNFPPLPPAERAVNARQPDIFDSSTSEEDRLRMLRERSGAADDDEETLEDSLADQRQLRLRFAYISPEDLASRWPDAGFGGGWAGPVPAAAPRAGLAQGPRAGPAQGPRPGPAFRAPPPAATPRQQLNSNPRVTLKRTNDQPQINTTAPLQDKLGNKPEARASVKKRVAPQPPAAPAPAPPPDPRRDLPYHSALQRRHHEQRQRQQQNAYNLAVGLPPVLDPAAKLEKLRKMDALHHGADRQEDYSHKLTGRVWHNSALQRAGERLGRGSVSAGPKTWEAQGPLKAQSNANAQNAKKSQAQDSGQAQGAMKTQGSDKASPALSQRRAVSAVIQGAEAAETRGEAPTRLADVQPMSPEEFMARFNELQLLREPRDIRSSLRELRRGLNEVTAPYSNSTNNNNNITIHNNNIDSNATSDCATAIVDDVNQLAEARSASPGPRRSPEEAVLVPCEFCCRPLRAAALLEHEKECRASLSHATPPRDRCDDVPLIPCEFCNETLPYYLVSEHQELCGNE